MILCLEFRFLALANFKITNTEIQGLKALAISFGISKELGIYLFIYWMFRP